MSNKSMIEVEGLSKRFGSVNAVLDLEFTIPTGANVVRQAIYSNQLAASTAAQSKPQQVDTARPARTRVPKPKSTRWVVVESDDAYKILWSSVDSGVDWAGRARVIQYLTGMRNLSGGLGGS